MRPNSGVETAAHDTQQPRRGQLHAIRGVEPFALWAKSTREGRKIRNGGPPPEGQEARPQPAEALGDPRPPERKRVARRSAGWCNGRRQPIGSASAGRRGYCECIGHACGIEVCAATRVHGLRALAAARVRFGYWRLTVLLRREGWRVNPKRVYRLYCEEGLAVRTKTRLKAAQRQRRPG